MTYFIKQWTIWWHGQMSLCFMALSLIFTRRVRVLSRGSSVTFACSSKQSYSYKYDFLGCKILNCFQDCFPTFSLLKMSRDILIYPEISSGHLGLHCLLSSDHTIALSWGVPHWLSWGWYDWKYSCPWNQAYHLQIKDLGFVSGPATNLRRWETSSGLGHWRVRFLDRFAS